MNRDTVIRLRVTEREAEILKKKAEAAGLTVSEYIRLMLIYKD